MVSISPSTRDDLVERGLPYEMVAIVPCGIDHGLYRPVAGSSSASPLIGWLGRVEKYKRLDNMLEAMVGLRKQIPDLRLVVIGDGGALQESRQLATHLGLDDCVEFAGFVSAERKVELLGQAHVLVNSSEKEGWGLTVIEGNACGTPTVASNVPGLRDSVVDGETGLLYEYADVAAMESALLKVLSDAQLRQRLETAALEWAARFTWDAAACDVETLMERSLHGGGDPGSLELQSPTF
jgi:glycosyltransferase involved in cell wall biosynthesis